MDKLQPCPHPAKSSCALPWGHTGPCKSRTEARLADVEGALRVALNTDGDHSPTCECRGCKAEARLAAIERRCYAISEPHLSGYRLVLGFATRAEVEAAHLAIFGRLAVSARPVNDHAS